MTLVEMLGERRFPFDIEVVGFSDEEGVRFSVPFIGSRALAGTFEAGLLERKDERGCSLREALAVVDVIAGQSRVDVTFTGTAGHAGTTPMKLRRDALACAAAWISEVEREAVTTSGLVATVGRIEAGL